MARCQGFPTAFKQPSLHWHTFTNHSLNSSLILPGDALSVEFVLSHKKSKRDRCRNWTCSTVHSREVCFESAGRGDCSNLWTNNIGVLACCCRYAESDDGRMGIRATQLTYHSLTLGTHCKCFRAPWKSMREMRLPVCLTSSKDFDNLLRILHLTGLQTFIWWFICFLPELRVG